MPSTWNLELGFCAILKLPTMHSFTLDLSTALLGVCVLLGYLTLRTSYRLYLHPLRKIPGPPLAAATHLVEFYYDVIKGGKFIWEIERMHEKYGRANPYPMELRVILLRYFFRPNCAH